MDIGLERSYKGHKDSITALAFKPSMMQLASGSQDHSVMVWNFKPNLRSFRFIGHQGPVTTVDFSPNNALLASGSQDKSIRLWIPNVKGEVTTFKAHTGTVRQVHFSNDSTKLLSCSDDKSIKLWTVQRTKFDTGLSGHLNWVRTAQFSPDCRLVLSGSDDKTVKLWDLRSKACVKTYTDHMGIVTSVCFHPAGSLIATGSMDKTIKLFDLRLLQADNRVHRLVQHYGDTHTMKGTIGGVNSVSFGGQNGEWLSSTGIDGSVKIWDVKEGHLFYTLNGHKNGQTNAAVFSPTGDYLATGGSDDKVMLWKTNFEDLIRSRERARSPERQTLDRTNKSHDRGISRPPSAAHPEIKSPSKASEVKGIQHHVAPISNAPRPIRVPNSKKIEVVQISEGERSKNPLNSKTTSLKAVPIPEQLVSTMNHLVSQIDILTQTLSILESRLTINEDRLQALSRGESPNMPFRV